VNTVCFESLDSLGRWRALGALSDPVPDVIRSKGYNTDADAILRALAEDLGLQPLRGAVVLLLGAGGAGRVAALKVASEGVQRLHLVNRTEARALALAGEIRDRYPQVQSLVGYPAEGPVDLVLNATSLGLQADDPMPLDQKQFSLTQARCVYDMIYRPSETALLKAAKAAGCRTANGLGMLLYQGAKALELWTERPAPIEVMRRALEQAIYGS
jgi:shikimate dehydrogenase